MKKKKRIILIVSILLLFTTLLLLLPTIINHFTMAHLRTGAKRPPKDTWVPSTEEEETFLNAWDLCWWELQPSLKDKKEATTKKLNEMLELKEKVKNGEIAPEDGLEEIDKIWRRKMS